MGSLDLGFQLIDKVLAHEGGYVNHPADKGGPTKWGVTEATARRYGYKGVMADLTREEAIEIYLQLLSLIHI